MLKKESVDRDASYGVLTRKMFNVLSTTQSAPGLPGQLQFLTLQLHTPDALES